MHAWQPARLAAAFADAESVAGLTRSEIARIAEVHRSQVSRWFSGEQRPSYDRIMRVAGYLKRDHEDLADEIVKAAGYGGPVERGPGSTIPPEVLAVIRRSYPPEQQREAVEMLEQLSARDGRERPGERGSPGEGRSGTGESERAG